MYKRDPVGPPLTPGQIAAHLLPMPVDQLLIDKLKADSEAALSLIKEHGLGSFAACLLTGKRPVSCD